MRANTTTGPLTRAFAYNPNGSLTRQCSGSSVSRSSNTCSGSDVASYGYDALERLIQVSLTGSQTLTESYGYDPQSRRILKTTNGAKTQYRYAGNDLYADYGTSLATPRTLYLQGSGTDEPLLALDPASPANRRYYHADGLGSLVAVTDTTGSVQASRRYDSFGRVLASSGGGLPTYGYSGREPDASGLIHYRARYYAPELGRFTQPDPIGLAGGINRYAYVGGDPVNFRDPSGWRAVVANPGGQTAYGGNADLLDPLAAMSPQDASAYEAQGGMLGTRSVMQPIVEAGIVAGATALTLGVADLIAGAAGVAMAGMALEAGNLATADVPVGGRGFGSKAAASGTASVNPASIRFSQSSVNGVEEITASMRANGWKGAPIDVVRMSDGALTAFDNTRLLAAQRAGIGVQATIREAGETFPAGRWTPKNGIQPATWEDAVHARIKQQNIGFRNAYPNGSPYTGSTQ